MDSIYFEDRIYDGYIANFEERLGIIGYCENCGMPIRYDGESREHRGSLYCEQCFDALYEDICDCCGGYILQGDDSLEEKGHIFCEDCMERRYKTE